MMTIAEQLLLLGLNDEKGTVLSSASAALPFGLAGAVILDLYFLGKVAIEEKKILVKDPSSTGEEILDEVLSLFADSNKPRGAQYWVSRIQSKVRKLKNRLGDKLVEKNILTLEERKFLGVFPANRYPEKNPAAEEDVRRRIRHIVMNGETPTERDVVLISLVKVCELVTEIFTREERKEAKKRIKELSESEESARVVSSVITEITIAVTAGVTAAITAATVSN